MDGTIKGGSSRVQNYEILARLDERTNEIIKRLDRHEKCFDTIEEKLDFVTTNKSKIENIDKNLDEIKREHKELENQFDAHQLTDKRVNWFLGITTLVGSIIGAIFGQQRL